MKRIVESSAAVAAFREGRDAFTRWASEARDILTGWASEARDIPARWASEARVVRALSRADAALSSAGGMAGRWARNSWLLGPPAEPEVIVIDLRETYTVGPLLSGLDRLAAVLGPAWLGSPPHRGLRRAEAAVADQPVRVVSVVLLGVVVGVLLATLAAGGAVGGWHVIGAGLALLGTRERRSAGQLRETVAGRALAALLVPPEPPEEQ